MFELDQFVSDCRAALRQDRPQQAVQEVVQRAVSTPGSVLKALGEPQRAEMQTLYRSADLTVLNVIWAPWMNLLPHNHRMWAIIGLYTGREDNMFWRRVPGGNGLVEAAGARALREKDAEPLGRDIIHSVSNPIARLTGAIHVYGGDFFGVQRSEWDAETLLEQQCSGGKEPDNLPGLGNIFLNIRIFHLAQLGCRALKHDFAFAKNHEAGMNVE
jgi:predicted metal-dependent enzyme (double-stranded beta helix superfamily)